MADLFDVGGLVLARQVGTSDLSGTVDASQIGVANVEGNILVYQTDEQDISGLVYVVTVGLKQDGWVMFDNDVNAILMAFIGCRVIAGMRVVQNSTADLNVRVRDGSYRVFGVKIDYTSALVALDAGGSYARKDIITATRQGTIRVVKGLESTPSPAAQTGPVTAPPNPPDIPVGDVVIAEVWVGAGATEIKTADITDRRVVWSE